MPCTLLASRLTLEPSHNTVVALVAEVTLLDEQGRNTASEGVLKALLPDLDASTATAAADTVPPNMLRWWAATQEREREEVRQPGAACERCSRHLPGVRGAFAVAPRAYFVLLGAEQGQHMQCTSMYTWEAGECSRMLRAFSGVRVVFEGVFGCASGLFGHLG